MIMLKWPLLIIGKIHDFSCEFSRFHCVNYDRLEAALKWRLWWPTLRIVNGSLLEAAATIGHADSRTHSVFNTGHWCVLSFGNFHASKLGNQRIPKTIKINSMPTGEQGKLHCLSDRLNGVPFKWQNKLMPPGARCRFTETVSVWNSYGVEIQEQNQQSSMAISCI